MPEIMVYVAEGRSPEQKKRLMKSLTAAIVRDFGVRPASVVVQIVESPRTAKARGGMPYDEIVAAKGARPELSYDEIIEEWSARDAG